MVSVRLEIEPEMCGPISVGTGAVIRLLSEHLALSLKESFDYVNRCVFDGERVELPAPSSAAANALIRALAELPAVPKIRAFVCD